MRLYAPLSRASPTMGKIQHAEPNALLACAATALDLDLGGEARISCEPPDDSDEGPSCGEPAPTQCSFTVERLGATLPATCSQSRCAQEDTPLTCDAQVQVKPTRL
eukprot:scaffold66729_cov33-Tisochrysis_lutea.AAC.3